MTKEHVITEIETNTEIAQVMSVQQENRSDWTEKIPNLVQPCHVVREIGTGTHGSKFSSNHSSATVKFTE